VKTSLDWEAQNNSEGDHKFLVCTFEAYREFICQRSYSKPESTYICRVQSSVWRLPKNWPPRHLSTQRVCPPPAPKAGGYTLARGWGGGGSIFWKTPDIGLTSYSIIPRRTKVILKEIISFETVLSKHIGNLFVNVPTFYKTADIGTSLNCQKQNALIELWYVSYKFIISDLYMP